MSAFVLPVQKAPLDSLPAWAIELAKQAVVLRKNKRHCMLVLRFDGLAWHILEAEPVVKVTAS